MKNSELNLMGVQELNLFEMQETEGGLVLLLACLGVGLILSSCVNTWNIQIGGQNNTINNLQVADSTLNGNHADGNSMEPIDLAERFNMPIGY